MAESSPSPTGLKPTLGLTGLTSNAMALIAPGAFLWLTYALQSAYGNPSAGMSMWAGILLATLLCLATAVSYAELSKLYPGAGSSYFFAEQAFLSKKQAFKWARLAKFMIGWASHLYYWVYPGVMVGVTALIAGYMIGQIYPATFNAAIPSPLFMILFCVVFSFGVAWIAYNGVGGTTGVNAVINVVQIVALLIFSVMAIYHRAHVTEGMPTWTLDSTGTPTPYVQDTIPDTSKTIPDPNNAAKTIQDPNATLPKVAADGTTPVWVMGGPKDANGKPTPTLFTVSYGANGTYGISPPDPKTGVVTFLYHNSAMSVVAPHKFQYVFVQACVAILILVGFESVTSMGEEAKNAKRDIPIAVIAALVIQGCFCYAFEYFAANYYIGSQYTNVQAAGDSAPLGSMMQLLGAYFWGSARAGWWFMMIEATTVFFALIGTTLSCMSTAARVTYAMGRDEEVPNHFGMLHGKKNTPHTAIWTLAAISTVIGIFAVYMNFCGPSAQADSAIAALPKNAWYPSWALFTNVKAAALPQSMLVVTLISNFGTFLLYMMTCITAIVAFREHHTFSGFKHFVVPIFGLLANLACMIFYLVGPFSVPGMSKQEPFFALAFVAMWGVYGWIFFMSNSKKTGKSVMITAPPAAA